MFAILVMIGIALIVLGIYKKRDPIISTISKPTGLEELFELKARVDTIESILFQDVESFIEEEEEIQISSFSENVDHSITYENIAKSMNAPSIYHSNSANAKMFQLLCQYEEENYTIEEISVLLNMNKGEILLLKSLYKNSN